MTLWPIQANAIDRTAEAIADGLRRILLTSPTGTGKSRVVCELIDIYTARGWHAVLYTNRKLLVEQLVKTLAAHGIECGVRAAGHQDRRELPVQIASLPTEGARTLKAERWQLHGTGKKCLVVIDEAHINAGPTVRQIMEAHVEAGHVYVGVTATPIDLGHLYEKLVVAGNVSEGRRCGALVTARHYGPDEPDLRALKNVTEGEDISDIKLRKVINQQVMFGRVMEWFDRLNPERRPTILFACGVPESLWFAEQFTAAGIPAGHIDGGKIWTAGVEEKSSPRGREDLLEASRTGRIKVLCNRFVLREGIDAPWLSHGIFATVFGSLQTYLQSGGRLIRAFPGLEYVTIQDHGGNWWRHGSLNADRTWELHYTPTMVSGLRTDRMRAGKEREPARCPQCAAIMTGAKCHLCGHEAQGVRSRPVVQTDGQLREMRGKIFKPHKVAEFQGGPKKWVAMYFRSLNSDRTFRAAAALFAAENYWQWPDPAWPMMPTTEEDWFRKVSEVDRSTLTGKGRHTPQEVED